MRMALAILLLTLSAYPSIGQKKQEPSEQKPNVSKETQRPVESMVVINNPSTSDKQQETKEESNRRPPFWDIYWPTVALVFVTGLLVIYAIKTLGAIRQQVKEMRDTGKQTDQLITESIAQTKSLIAQAQSLAQSAYHLGESASATSRSASAMESVAEKIAVSTEAAKESVSAINKQMRAYICVVIGTALYQERARNMKFQAVPTIVNNGLTPAHKVSFQAKAAILPYPLPDDFKFPLPDIVPGTLTVGPRQPITATPWVDDFVDDGEVEGIKNTSSGKALYTWGLLTYEDIFGNPQYAKWCHMYTWLADGKTTWGYYDNRHNDAS